MPGALAEIVLGLNSVVDFFSMHLDFSWGFNTKSDLISVDAKDRNHNVFANPYTFANLASKYEQNFSSDARLMQASSSYEML